MALNLGLERKRVLVTGSSKGIGFSISSAFVREGASVWVTGRSQPDLSRACSRLSKLTEPRRVESTACDLTLKADRDALAAAVLSKWHGLDVLVLNLGSGRSVPGVEIPDEEWRRVLELNLFSAMDTLRAMLPLLRKGRQANVVFVGSIAGREAIGAPLAYGAAKAALSHSMKACSRSLGREGVRVNMIVPGNIFFKGGTWDRKVKEAPERVKQLLKDDVPLERFGKPEEVADGVLFLASRRAAFVTGASLVVDGGQTVFPG